MPLALRNTVHACISNNRIALLDLESATYFCAPEDLDLPLQKIMAGERLAVEERLALDELIADGILVEDSDAARPQTEIPKFPSHQLTENGASSWLDTLRACCAQINAMAVLKFRPLAETVERRRARRVNLHTHLADTQILARTANAFAQSERLLPSNDRCLRRSLAMVDYLARFNIPAVVVIAVKMRPFGAHAWVQIDDVLLNDSLDNIRTFTPILAI